MLLGFTNTSLKSRADIFDYDNNGFEMEHMKEPQQSTLSALDRCHLAFRC
jgi:hypothetical protein